MARKTTQWFLSLQMTIFLLLIFVRGNEDAEDAYKNGRHLVLEYFLPINAPEAVNVPLRREKRDVEGSGEDDVGFSELKESEDADNATQSAVGKFTLEDKSVPSLTAVEGSGEVDDGSESSSEEEKAGAAIIGESELLTTAAPDETTKTPEAATEGRFSSTEMIFDKSEDFDSISTPGSEETTTAEAETTPIVMLVHAEMDNKDELETTSPESTTAAGANKETEATTPAPQETAKPQSVTLETTTTAPTEPTTVLPGEDNAEPPAEATTAPPEETTTESAIPVAMPGADVTEDRDATPPAGEPPTAPPTAGLASDAVPNATEALPTPPEPVTEEAFKETKVDRKLEAVPGNIRQKENLSLAADTLLIANTRLMDSEENVQLSSAEPKRLGAYIVIALILLSFLTLIGYITFKKRMNRKRQEFESNQESNDTEKALLSLSDYKDNSELEENHLKNNEITPIVVKSNSQINRFEKNTNFSSPKNLNTTANEKNIEKDNVLKSTAENLTQVIIEDSPKDVEEDKNASGMEKLIVKTRIDQDSIPKKPIIINRSSTGYIPIPQDNS